MIGQKLGHYHILEQVGSGGMGVVYRARDEQLERDVALKVLPSGTLSDEASRRHFRKEALALAKISHPNIETVYEFASQDGMDFLVMEYVPGKTLADKLAAGALPEKEVVSVGMQVVSGLEEAHERGIVHRDLKPKNIAITPKGQVKILDFGLAKLLPKPDDATTDELSETQAGAGTLPYMPPEQLQGESVDARADIYTMGAVLYEMATNSKAISEIIPSRLIEAVLNRPPIAPRSINSRVSPELERIILKCLDKDPTRRYQTAQELLVDLRRVDSGAAPSPTARFPHQKSFWNHVAGPAKYAAVVLLAVAAVLPAVNFHGWRDRLLGRSTAPQIRSLAVLPFDNLSGDADQDYFADGMTEALITDLGRVQSLRVISRTSVMHYKATRRSLADISRELNVDAIVEGSVSRSGDLAQVTARLVQGPTDTLLWSQTYQRDVQNVLVLQAELARAIVGGINVTLTPQDQARLAENRTVNPAAHEAYLKGNYLRWGTQEQRERSRQFFEEAIRVDPSYAPAYAGLANYYRLNTELQPQAAMTQAKQFAQRAVDLDPSLSEAHLALGRIDFFGDWDWPKADAEFKRALDLNPGDSEAHRAYSSYLVALGRDHEAMAEVQRAEELDPLYVATQITAGWVFYFSRQFDKAIDQCRQALDLDANFAGAYDCIGLSSLAETKYEDAVTACEKAVALSDHAPSRMVGLGEAYAIAGKRSDAKALLGTLKAQSRKSYVPPVFLARIYLALGERQQALTLLQDAYAEHDSYLVWLKSERAYDPLRKEPRFQELLRQVGFPD